ncbi:MAG: hypothetical protein Kow0031_21550 [Anaerolineae bacterium]
MNTPHSFAQAPPHTYNHPMANSQRKFGPVDAVAALTLFGLALWLGGSNLAHFVTADEHNWVYRSGLFLSAFLRGDWPGTSVWLTPGVTTTWLGSAGLAAHYWLAQGGIGQPFGEWLLSFNRNRVDLAELLALRRAMVLFVAVMVVVIYGLARRLWSRPLALLGALLVLLDAHLLSVARIIGHDAPATLLLTASLLALLLARQRLVAGRPALWWFALSGFWAGLGVLSKAPVLFLVPFAGLLGVVSIWQDMQDSTAANAKVAEENNKNSLRSLRPLRFNQSWSRWLVCLLLWGSTMWLTFIVFWPAAWVSPWGQTWAVISNAFLSSAGLEDADIQPYWATPDLGLFYYLINGAFKLSPLVLVGVIVAAIIGLRQVIRQRNVSHLLNSEIFWLLLFALLFGLFMSLGVKQSPRYILPAFPALAFVAAWGWVMVTKSSLVTRHSSLVIRNSLFILLTLAALLLTLPYAPYYFSYYNPLLGGATTAQRLVRIGWGEGMDEVGRWLSQQPDAAASRAGVRYKVSAYPFFGGELATPVDEELDYVVFYIKQTQSGYPTPEILAYFEQRGALHRVEINGVDYAQIYAGPAMQPIEGGGRDDLPLAFRPDAIYAPIGQTLSVALLWPAGGGPAEPVTLALAAPDGSLRLESTAAVETLAPGVNVSTHTFALPPETPRLTASLLLGDTPLGRIKSRLMSIPPDFSPANVTAQSVRLAGYRHRQTGDALQVELAWQAWPRAANDFTVFVQLLDGAGQRVAGVDVAPQPGFTALDRKEIQVSGYSIPLPADLPPGDYTLLVGLYYFAGEELVNVGAAPLDGPLRIE